MSADPLSAPSSAQQTGSEYQEARFKKGVARKTKENGLDVNKSVKIKEIPSNCRLQKLPNSDLWLEGVPRGATSMQLTFPETEEVTTNSIRIDSRSLTVHQYTFSIFNKAEVDEAADPKQVDEATMTPLTLSQSQRRDIYNKFRPSIYTE